MNVTIFKDVTAETALAWFDEEAEKHQGLYVDMDDPEQRKYVKTSAATIKGVLKAVDVARIQKVKEFRSSVESEANYIKGRLEASNEPFTLLLDDWEAERKRVLDLAKDKKRQEELFIQIGLDHEYALLLDKSYLADKLASEKTQAQHDEAIRVDAAIRATQAAKNAQEATDRAIALDAANRLANKEHVRGINRDILATLQNNGVGEFEARALITLIAQGKINNITINY